MTQATALYRQYEQLTKGEQKRFKKLIEKPHNPVLLSIEKGLQEIELIRAGKKKAKTLDELLDDIERGQ
jgi:hypothetical protein